MTTARELRLEQEKLTPKEDLAPYGGKWVALRDGHVVASDADPARLRHDERVAPGDVIIPVRPAEGRYLIL